MAFALAGYMLLLPSGCAESPQYYRGGIPEVAAAKTIAALPLVNFSQYEEASDIVLNSLIVELLETRIFKVIDPGIVDTIVLEKRLRLTDRLPLAALQELGKQLGVEYLLVGSINEYSMIHGRNTQLPTVSISLRIVVCESGQIIWASTHSRRGDDEESLFGIGRIESLEQLASVTVTEMINTLKP
jgi:TolB-like protein